MKKFIVALMLVLVSSIALALPTPKDIEAAVSAGQLSKAEAMLNEVIKEKPASARAHYELGEVLARAGRRIEARDALLEAKRLDPALKFARDAQTFNTLLDKVSSGAVSSGPSLSTSQGSSAPVMAARPSQPVQQDAPFPWGYVLMGAGALVVVWLVVRRMAPPAASRGTLATAGGAPGAPGYGGGYAPGYGAPPQGGSGIGGAVLGGVAGMAAGYGLAKMLEHGAEARTTGGDGSNYSPIEPAQPDFGNFDSGNGGDSWDNSGDSGGSGSDDSSW
jgi:uncharacterized protein